jgi:type 1 fimbriae regulatory protein FimB/type 1 fimbriae regulatory protein FimE
MEDAEIIGKPNLRIVPPPTEKPTVTPRRLEKAKYRARDYLTPAEVGALIKAAKSNRNGARDSLMVMTAYRHGLRVSELIDLRWTQVSFKEARLHVRRLKGSKDSTHPIQGDELRALRELRRGNPEGEFIFVSECGTPFSADGVQRLIERLAVPRRPDGPEATPAHGPACLRPQTGERGQGHTCDPGLPWARQYPERGSLYGAFAGPVQGLQMVILWLRRTAGLFIGEIDDGLHGLRH